MSDVLFLRQVFLYKFLVPYKVLLYSMQSESLLYKICLTCIKFDARNLQVSYTSFSSIKQLSTQWTCEFQFNVSFCIVWDAWSKDNTSCYLDSITEY